MESMPDTPWVAKHLRLGRSWAYRKIDSNKTTPNQCLNQPSSEKLPSAVDGNSYRDPQLDSVERERDFGISSPKWDVFVTFFP